MIDGISIVIEAAEEGVCGGGGKTRCDWYLRLKRVQFKLANLQGNVLAQHKEQRQKRGGERRERGRGGRRSSR